MRCPKIWVLRAREKQLFSWWLLVFVVNIHAYGGICAEKRCSPCPPAHPRQRPCEYKEWAPNAGTLGWDTHGLDTPWTAPPLGSCSSVRKRVQIPLYSQHPQTLLLPLSYCPRTSLPTPRWGGMEGKETHFPPFIQDILSFPPPRYLTLDLLYNLPFSLLLPQGTGMVKSTKN